MNKPDFKFFDNVLRIMRFNIASRGIAVLELEDKEDLKLYLVPIDTEDPNVFNIIFFQNRENAEKFEKIKELQNLNVGLNLGKLLEEHDVNAIIISISGTADQVKMHVTRFGKYEDDEHLTKAFYNRIIDFLNEDNLKIKFLNKGLSEDFGLPAEELLDLCLNALALYLIFLEKKEVFDYESPVNNEPGYFLAVYNDNFEETRVLAAYMILPKEKNDESLTKNNSSNVKAINEIINEDGAIVLQIRKVGHDLKCETISYGKMKDISTKEKDEIVSGFLKALKNITIEANKA